MVSLRTVIVRGFMKGWAPVKLTGCGDDSIFVIQKFSSQSSPHLWKPVVLLLKSLMNHRRVFSKPFNIFQVHLSRLVNNLYVFNWMKQVSDFNCPVQTVHLLLRVFIFTMRNHYFGKLWFYQFKCQKRWSVHLEEVSHPFLQESLVNTHKLGYKRFKMVNGFVSLVNAMFIVSSHVCHFSFQTAVTVGHQFRYQTL